MQVVCRPEWKRLLTDVSYLHNFFADNSITLPNAFSQPFALYLRNMADDVCDKFVINMS